MPASSLSGLGCAPEFTPGNVSRPRPCAPDRRLQPLMEPFHVPVHWSGARLPIGEVLLRFAALGRAYVSGCP